MIQEAKELQQRAVKELLAYIESSQKEITFRAPTGSGKTYMMADMMNHVLSARQDVVFLVSTLSKGDLAGQNYNRFKEYSSNNFTHINPYLISTETAEEESVYIPTSYNVYVLPRDLYKKNGKLMEGPMQNFLNTVTQYYFGQGLNKKIFLVRDECHQATNNLDSISDDYFSKIINFSATPNLKRGQLPDVEITDEEAEEAKIIKKVIPGTIGEGEHLDEAMDKFQEIREAYRSMKVNPCLIIQISNEDKADEEWNNIIKPELDKEKNKNLTWMMIVSDEKKCDTNDKIKEKPVSKWKEYAKERLSPIDVIIFKMVISEGWDIPRACMLYQIRATTSKQLDEQVVGRVRRNPRLLDFEDLNKDQQKLALKSWVWGVRKENKNEPHELYLWNDGKEIKERVRIKTIKLKDVEEREDFDMKGFIEKQNSDKHHSIFTLYHQLENSDDKIKELCYDYAGNDIGKWFHFTENLAAIKKEYANFELNYSESMEIDQDVSFPLSSAYYGENNTANIYNWVWIKKEGGSKFAFDSEAENEWANFLSSVAGKCSEVLTEDEEDRYLWGKNFPVNSEIRYQYYLSGIHSSYPDFIMKDNKGRIHLFEVKSLNKANGSYIDDIEYKEKIEALKKCYKACSEKLNGYCFYLPIKVEDDWIITKYENGEEVSDLRMNDVKKFIKE